MKPAPFDYQAPATLREAIDLLVSDPEATAIAGGQSLIPVLAFRLATPSILVDLRRVPGLGDIAVGDGGVRLGARVRRRDIEDDDRLGTAHPLLQEAIAHVAHDQIRNRGTVGGSLAHADPAAELPGVAVTCDAEITLVGAAGTRTMFAGNFFTGPLSTVRQPDEIITELHSPLWPRDRRWAFREFAQRRGDFALAGALPHDSWMRRYDPRFCIQLRDLTSVWAALYSAPYVVRFHQAYQDCGSWTASCLPPPSRWRQ